MKEEIGTAFSLVESSKQLWDELSERYSRSNAPLLYQLERELGNIEQEEMSVIEYYGKLKRYWDEIYELEGIPSCECIAMSKCTCNLYYLQLVQKTVRERRKMQDYGVSDEVKQKL